MDNVKDSLSGRVGVTPIKARAALDQLGQVLAGPASALEDGVVFIAPMNRGKARDFVPSLRSPTFADLARGQNATEASERGTIDVRAIIAADGRDAARRRVCDAIVEELARILRPPQEDVPPPSRSPRSGSFAHGRRARDLDRGALCAAGLADRVRNRADDRRARRSDCRRKRRRRAPR
jgi:hypothetical protein